MDSATRRVYCAGPLFNAKEREEMAELAEALEGAGLKTFLPQRDGLEFTVCVPALVDKGIPHKTAANLVAKAIFAVDVYQVLRGCDAIVVNLNGRVPDEGAVSEAAIAWCGGKVVVGYKADERSVFLGQDNPLVAGLFVFGISTSIQEAVQQVKRSLASHPSPSEMKQTRREQIEAYLNLGERLWKAMKGENKVENVANLLCADSGVETVSRATRECDAPRA